MVITPIAYLINPSPEGSDIGLPSFGATYVNARQKNVESFGVTETLFGRVELGYNASRFGTGSLQTDILKYTGVDIGRNDVWLHTLNARVAVIKENDFDSEYVPAITFGVHGKYNDGINEINRKLGGVLSSAGYSRDYGVEFTATASKTFLVYGHPLILSITGRATDASNLGYTGYSGRYDFSVEGNAVFGITDWLFAAFEYRQKLNKYDTISAGGKELVGSENDWWTVGLAAVINPHITVTAGYGHFGTVLNREHIARREFRICPYSFLIISIILLIFSSSLNPPVSAAEERSTPKGCTLPKGLKSRNGPRRRPRGHA